MSISGGTVKATNDNGIFCPSGYGGTVNISAGTVTGNVNGIFNGGSAKITITGGTITGTNYEGAKNYPGSTGTIIIDSSSGSISTTNPLITGKGYGLYICSGSKGLFYNGKIRGASGAILSDGTLTVRSGYTRKSVTETVSSVTYKAEYLVASKSTASLSTFSLTRSMSSPSSLKESNAIEYMTEKDDTIVEENNKDSETNSSNNNDVQTDNNSLAREEEIYQKENLKIRLEAANNYNGEHSDTTTIWKDTTENKNDGVITNGVWGKDYLELNGTTSVVKVPEINSDYKTIEVKFSVNELSKIANQYIIGNSSDGGVYIFISSDGYINGKINIDGVYQTVKSTTKVEEEKTYNVAISYDGNVINLYINGTEESKKEVIGKIKNPEESAVMLIGANSNYDKEEEELLEFFNGKIYTVAIYNESLTNAQVNNNILQSEYEKMETQ